MRFGIYIPNLEEENPSGASFEQATLRELRRLYHSHELFIFTHSKNVPAGSERIKYVHIGRYRLKPIRKAIYSICSAMFSALLKIYPSGKIKLANFFIRRELKTTPLNKALIENRIRIIWHTFSAEPIDIPYIYGVLDCNHWIHSYQPEFAPSSLSWLEIDKNLRKIIQQATYVVASTEVLKQQIVHIHGIYEKKVRVIPFFTPEIASVQNLKRDDKSIESDLPDQFLFYPARLMSQKNHITIFKALCVLKSKYKLKLPLVMVGKDNGNKHYLFEMISQLKLQDDVIYLGEVSFPNLVLLYKKALALVYASMNGPDNFPPLEAFSLGCPVIASRLEGAEEQLGDNALLFETMNEEELAERIYSLYSNDDFRSELILRGYARAAKWKAEDYVKDLLAIVDEFDKVSQAWDADFFRITGRWNSLMK